jgi:hypothetical protein
VLPLGLGPAVSIFNNQEEAKRTDSG